MPGNYKWRPISDYEADPKTLTDGELDSLQRIWQRQKSELTELQALDEFDKRLRREWAIETGIIEDVYRLDRGVARTLIEKGIAAALIPHDSGNKDSEMVARIIQDHYDVLEGVFDFVGGKRQLSAGYIKELHAALLRNQETHPVVDSLGRVFEKQLERGTYKTVPNNPSRPDGSSLHEYCPPEHVASEMDRLILMHDAHQTQLVPHEVEAAWLHHRFTQIHPFADGNGRVARAISSLVFIKAGWFPLIVKREDRSRYIEALEKADIGDLRPLVALFVEAQRNTLIQAADVAYDVKPVTSPHEAVLAARDRLLERGLAPLPEWIGVKRAADDLAMFARRRFEELASDLKREIGAVVSSAQFVAEAEDRLGVSVAAIENLGYDPDYLAYVQSVKLILRVYGATGLILSFLAIGPRFHGLIGVLGFLWREGSQPTLIEGGSFQLNYEEPAEKAQSRFAPWLERVITVGLSEWRRSL